MWSTAPSTPISQHRGNQDSEGHQDLSKITEVPCTSYERAISNIDRPWEGGREGERRGQIPKHISSNQAMNMSAGASQGFAHIPGVGVSGSRPPEVVSSSSHSPARIHRGFMLDQFDATKPADLPGSRGAAVITTPPHPQTMKTGPAVSETRPRARSIEEVDRHRENYVTSLEAYEGLSGGSYCLSGLSSLIISQDGGRGKEERMILSDRKASDTSTVSVSVVSV